MITVFGLGFVGLTTALSFSHFGEKVYGIDVNEERKSILRNGKLPFLEPHLDKVLVNTLNENFIVEDDIKNAIKQSDIIFYCVGTPYGENGEADLTQLFSAIDETIKNIDKNKKYTLVVKSTIPPSTTTNKVIPYIESKGYKVGENIFVANNPEFLREGRCWEDVIEADRIVIGTNYDEAFNTLKKIYKPFNVPIFKVTPNTGEFIKYLSNTLLATMISYSNEMAEVAYSIGDIDIKNAFKVLHMDKRWDNANMKSYVYPGVGYGGYCLPKDTNALYSIAKSNGINPKILEEVINMNDNMPTVIANRIIKNIKEGAKIGVLGLSFKPESDDVRESPSAKVIKHLLDEGYSNITAYDPVANDEFKKYYNFDIQYNDKLESICDEADVLVILTAWDEFKIIKQKTNKLILDYRYM